MMSDPSKAYVVMGDNGRDYDLRQEWIAAVALTRVTAEARAATLEAWRVKMVAEMLDEDGQLDYEKWGYDEDQWPRPVGDAGFTWDAVTYSLPHTSWSVVETHFDRDLSAVEFGPDAFAGVRS